MLFCMHAITHKYESHYCANKNKVKENKRIYKKRRCGMIANETTIHKRPK